MKIMLFISLIISIAGILSFLLISEIIKLRCKKIGIETNKNMRPSALYALILVMVLYLIPIFNLILLIQISKQIVRILKISDLDFLIEYNLEIPEVLK